MTQLSITKNAYATTTIAVYQAIIVRWSSALRLWNLADGARLSYQMAAQSGDKLPTALQLRQTKRERTQTLMAVPAARSGSWLRWGFLPGRDIRALRGRKQVALLLPGAVPSKAGAPQLQRSLYDQMAKAARDFANDQSQALASGIPGSTNLADALRAATQPTLGGRFVNFWPPIKLEEFLSPIGIAQFYRQLYFNVEEGVGPLETAFTVAPLETLEVVYTTTRRQVHEEVLEIGSETTSELAEETKDIDEVSDKVSFMLQQDASASMSARAGVTVGVFEGSGSSEGRLSQNNQRSGEEASRRLKEVTRRASERITKSFRLQTRDLDEFTSTNLTRRVIENKSDKPVSYGLRRVLRKVRVKVQSLGPRLIWQLYVNDPGRGLIRSRFVHFREAEPIAVPEIPPGVPPRPVGAAEIGSDILPEENADQGFADLEHSFITLTIVPGRDRVITTIVIDSIYVLDGWGNPDKRFEILVDKRALAGEDIVFDDGSGSYTVTIGLHPGYGVVEHQVNYTYQWEPSPDIMKAWEDLRVAAMEKATQETLEAEFQKQKTLITEKSKVRARPAADLRREERYEVMSRLTAELFGHDPNDDPQPLDIELFHQYFDLESMFSYTHPSWWQPRTRSSQALRDRMSYEITSESEPAPLGRSLGWHIQLDGDARRNEFLNSPWVRTCLPIRPGFEKQALAWLAEHVEGDIGYDPAKEPLKALLEEVAETRAREAAVGAKGPEYVVADTAAVSPSTTATGTTATGGTTTVSPPEVYPVIDEFDIIVPTDGFVYDTLTIV